MKTHSLCIACDVTSPAVILEDKMKYVSNLNSRHSFLPTIIGHFLFELLPNKRCNREKLIVHRRLNFLMASGFFG